MGGQYLRQPRGLMPGRIINGEDPRFAERGRIGPCEVLQMDEKRLLQAGRFRATRPGSCLAWTLQQAGRQLPRYRIHRGKAIDKIFVVPGPHDRPLAFNAERGVERRDEREARFILAYQDTFPGVGLFFSPANSALATAWRCGSPRRYRYVGR